MKIAYFVHCYPPAKGGLEYLSGEIVDILRKAGHEVHVFTGKGETLDSYKTFDNWVDENQDTDYIHRLPLRFFWQRLANKFLNKLIFVTGFFSPWYFGPILEYSQQDKEVIADCDLVFGAGMPTKMFYDSYRFARKYKKRLIVHPSYHDVSYYNRSVFFQQVLSYAEKVILQTPLEAESIQKNYLLSKHKIAYLTFTPFNDHDIAQIEKQVNIKVDKILQKITKDKIVRIGYVGQISPRKNLDYLKDLLSTSTKRPALCKECKIELLIAGAKTNSSEEVEKKLSLVSNVNLQIIYDFEDNAKKDIYGNIDFFVNPSREESLGLVNFEAISNNCLLFVNNRSAFFTLLQDSLSKKDTLKDYLIVDNISDLISLGKNSDLLKKRLTSQVMLLKKFTIKQYSDSLVQLISGHEYEKNN